MPTIGMITASYFSNSVVKLFNAIQQAQQAATAAQEEAKSNRGSGKPTLPAPSIPSKHKEKGKGSQKSSDGENWSVEEVSNS